MTSFVSRWQVKAQQKARIRVVWLCIALALAIYLGITQGAMHIDVWSPLTALEQAILQNIRAPRVLMTMATGAGLAMCGVILQALTRNPLADPAIIGVSSFAALFAALAIFLSVSVAIPQWLAVFFIPVMAFIGSVLALVLLLVTAGYKQTVNTLVLILTGVALNAGAQTLLGFIIYLSDDETLRAITFWQLGSYSGIRWDQAIGTSICVGLSYVFFTRNAKPIMLIQLGEQHAKFQGIAVNKLKRLLLLLVALVTALCVCFTGIVGFIGLVVPHITRMVVGANLTILLPCSILVGACLVTLADMAARVLVAPAELPIGLLTCALGVPFFLGLILIEKRKYQHD